MCGIFGYVGEKNSLQTTLLGLKQLEYRGYDSAGIAGIEKGKLLYFKDAGKISLLEERILKKPLELEIAIGHTRWATHGKPNTENAHPHFDEKKKPKYRYYAFMLIGVGIEMLGACFDNEDWHSQKRGLSEKRFNKALVDIHPLNKYNSKKLYQNFRCGMCHVLVPREGIGLNCKIEGGANLSRIAGKEKNENLLLQVESFYKDFSEACDYMLELIDNHKVDKLGKKTFKKILNVSSGW